MNDSALSVVALLLVSRGKREKVNSSVLTVLLFVDSSVVCFSQERGSEVGGEKEAQTQT